MMHKIFVSTSDLQLKNRALLNRLNYEWKGGTKNK